MNKLHIILFIFLLFGCNPEIKVNKKKGGSGKKNIEQKSLKIAAFNTKTFGTKKSSDPDILKRIIQIIEKYDIILLQEIRNKNLDCRQCSPIVRVCEIMQQCLACILLRPSNIFVRTCRINLG